MENRRDQLDKFLHVFYYKITELTNEISPRQYQINSLMEQFNKVQLFRKLTNENFGLVFFKMENECDLFNENNEKSLIEISHFKSRLTAMDEDLKKQFFDVQFVV